MRISAVISSYNHGPYLRECIQTALDQTLPPHEVIVVDDGSSDDSPETIRSFGDAIRPIFQPNRGTYSALNAGIAAATGDWIAVHNSDDAWLPAKLEKQAAVVERHPEIQIVHTGFVCIHADGTEFARRPDTVTDYTGPEVSELLPLLLHTMPIIISSTMLRRDPFNAAGGFDEGLRGTGDWDLCLRISQSERFGYVAEPLTRVRKHEDNSGTNPNRLPSTWQNEDWQRVCARTLPRAACTLFERARRGDIDRREAALALASLGVVHLRSGEIGSARRVLTMAAKLDPTRAKTWLRLLSSLWAKPRPGIQYSTPEWPS